jgi:nucleoside-diphosphate-sugar epimerase
MKILILGVNGFIGHHLTKLILTETDWEVYGMDLATDKLGESLGHPRFHFVEGDITINKEWIEYHVKKCDAILPLVAIATPQSYVKEPLRVFELDFEENLKLVRMCVKYKKWLLFPSTSEVYGMCPDEEFDEETSNLVVGPVNKQRWIYSISKQLLDRVIHAYGIHEKLKYTCFRPFNFVGPRLDRLNIDIEKEGSSRVATEFMSNLVTGQPIKLVNGGKQRRAFIYIEDGTRGILAMLRNPEKSQGQIFNLGNPKAECSMRELAEKMQALFEKHKKRPKKVKKSKLIDVPARQFYGAGYQDMDRRVPSIKKMKTMLGWAPKVGLDEALSKTVDAFLDELPADFQKA